MSSNIKVTLDRNGAISTTKRINVSLVEMQCVRVFCTTNYFSERKSPLTHRVLCEVLLVLLVCVTVTSKYNDVFAAITIRSMIQC